MSPAAATKPSAEILVVATPEGESVTLKTAAPAKTKAKAKTAAKAKPAAKAVEAAEAKATPAKASRTTKAKAAKAVEADADASDLTASADALLLAADQAEALPEAAPAASASTEKDDKAAKALAGIKVGPKGVYTEDSIRVYLQEIGRIRLLRPDEEIELARKIADLLQLEELAAQFEADHGHLPDTKEWAALVEMPLIKFRRRLMLGRRAKEKMVQSNLRLVVSIAKKYMNRGLSFQDLIQEGSLGLIRAAEKFDHEKGYKF